MPIEEGSLFCRFTTDFTTDFTTNIYLFSCPWGREPSLSPIRPNASLCLPAQPHTLAYAMSYVCVCHKTESLVLFASAAA